MHIHTYTYPSIHTYLPTSYISDYQSNKWEKKVNVVLAIEREKILFIHITETFSGNSSQMRKRRERKVN